MFRTFTPQIPFPSNLPLSSEGTSRSDQNSNTIRGYRQRDKKSKIKFTLRYSIPNLKNKIESRPNSPPLKPHNTLLSLKVSNDLSQAQKPLSYSRTVISLKPHEIVREEAKPIRIKQIFTNNNHESFLPYTDRVIEMGNTIYTNRTRSVSVASKGENIKYSSKQELTKTLASFKHNLRQNEGRKSLGEPNKEPLNPFERSKNTPVKVLRAKSIPVAPTSFDNSPFQECVDVGVYKYSGIHKGSVGKAQLTIKEVEEYKTKNNKSPMSCVTPLNNTRRQSMNYFRPQTTALKREYENNQQAMNRIQQENKAFESLLKSLEESSGAEKELKDGVEPLQTKEQKSRNTPMYSRQLTAQTYLFNKTKVFGHKDPAEGETAENNRELSGRINSHFLLSDLIRKRKFEIKRAEQKNQAEEEN